MTSDPAAGQTVVPLETYCEEEETFQKNYVPCVGRFSFHLSLIIPDTLPAAVSSIASPFN